MNAFELVSPPEPEGARGAETVVWRSAPPIRRKVLAGANGPGARGGSTGRTSDFEAMAAVDEPPTAVVVMRNPHMDISGDGVLGNGSVARVSVFLDNEEDRPGEKAEKAKLMMDPGETSLTVDVWLVASP